MAVISTDDVANAANMAEYVKAEYPVLADPTQVIAKRYEVFDLLNDGVAAPAVFVIDEGRVIQWSYIGRSVSDRPSAARILDAILEVAPV